MHASIRALLDDAAEFGLEQRLLDLATRATLLCDEAFGQWMATLSGADVHSLTSAEQRRGALPPDRDVIVCAMAHESTWLDRVRRAHPEATVRGVFRDLLPALVTKRVPVADVAVERRFLILCAPRSGSYFLSGLLANAGVGAPREHLRSSICSLARRGCLQLLEFLADLEKSGTVGGSFGTKLISHYAFEAIDSGVPAEELLAYLTDRSFRTIHLVRNNRIERAVSFYLASATGVWTTTDEQEGELPPYDFDRIHESYQFLSEQEQLLRKFVAHLPDVLEVTYEELDRDTASVFSSVLKHLGLAASIDLPPPATARQRGEHSRNCADRYRADLESRGTE